MNLLKEEIYQLLRTNSDLQAKIMLGKKVSYATVRRWAVAKDSKLNEFAVLEIICNHLNLAKPEMEHSHKELFANEENNLIEQ